MYEATPLKAAQFVYIQLKLILVHNQIAGYLRISEGYLSQGATTGTRCSSNDLLYVHGRVVHQERVVHQGSVVHQGRRKQFHCVETLAHQQMIDCQ